MKKTTLRYAVRPKPTIRGWYVWAVEATEKGERWADKPFAQCDTKRLAKSLAEKMNEELTFGPEITF